MQPISGSHVRPGLQAVTPYLILDDAVAFASFASGVFGAKEQLRVDGDNGKIVHAEIRIDDATVSFAQATSQYRASIVPLHVYVADVDEVYKSALQAGAESLAAPTDQEYGDRDSAVRDSNGLNWYIATRQGKSYKPEGLPSVVPYLHVSDGPAFIDFTRRAFEAELLEKHGPPDGRIMHAKLLIGGGKLELAEAHGQWQPTSPTIQVYFPDVDAAYRQALEQGASGESAPEDKPYGERMAAVLDPQGIRWLLTAYFGKRG